MDSDQGKLFIGGISWETTEENLRGYFEKYGEVLQTVIMRDKLTGKPRGFGFVVFADPSILDRVLEDTHTIDGRTVEAKRALSREQQTTGRSENPNSGRGGSTINTRTKKIFVGGLPASLSEDEFRQYFQTYGNVVDVVVMYDQNTQRPRGFGFISFDEEEAVDRVLHKTFHDLQGKQVEVKRALPKDGNSSSGAGGARFGSSGGSYQSYGAGPGNGVGSYDNSASRYGQQQTAGGGGYPSYGSGGYGSQPSYGGYGYGGPASGYGGPTGGYGAPASGYGGPASGYGGGPASGYGNQNAQQGGYASGGQPGQQKSSWNSQAPTGYGGPGSGYAGPGQPQSQGYGGYGSVQGNSVADQGAGYGDVNANAGYGSWNQQGGGYGGGYGGPQPRQ